ARHRDGHPPRLRGGGGFARRQGDPAGPGRHAPGQARGVRALEPDPRRPRRGRGDRQRRGGGRGARAARRARGDRQPEAGAADRARQDQDRRHRRRRAGQAVRQRLPAGGVGARRAHPGPAAAGQPADATRPAADAHQEHRAVDPARAPRAALPARRPVRRQRTGMAGRPSAARGRALGGGAARPDAGRAARGPALGGARHRPARAGGRRRPPPDDHPRRRHGRRRRAGGGDRRRGPLRLGREAGGLPRPEPLCAAIRRRAGPARAHRQAGAWARPRH
ncbi:MAG: Mobile element protein, partial [uncultured Gemmatimonadaceae bacterium]